MRYPKSIVMDAGSVAAVALLATSAVLGAAGCRAARTALNAPLPSAPEPARSPPAGRPDGTTFPLAGAPEGVVIDASGMVAVSVRDPAGLVLFPLLQPASRRTVPLPGAARHLALAGPNGPVLAPGETDDRLIKVGLPDGQVLEVIPVGRQPHDSAPVDGAVFVGDELADTVHIVGGGVAKVVPAPVQPGGVAAATDGSAVVVVGVRGRRITAYRPDGATIGTANCGAGPTHVVAGDGGLFWVADTNGDAILAFRVGSSGPVLIGQVQLGHGSRPYGLAYDHARSTLWVTLTGSNRLLALPVDGATASMGPTFSTVRQPNSVAVDPSSGALVVTGSTPDGAIQIIR